MNREEEFELWKSVFVQRLQLGWTSRRNVNEAAEVADYAISTYKERSKLKLYELRPTENIPEFEPEYSKAFAFVVRASSEKEAREFASKDCGNEGDGVWLDSEKTTCIEVLNEGVAGVVIRGFVNRRATRGTNGN